MKSFSYMFRYYLNHVRLDRNLSQFRSDLVKAPIYFFDDIETFDSDFIKKVALDLLETEINLPYNEMIIEVPDIMAESENDRIILIAKKKDPDVFISLFSYRNGEFSGPHITCLCDFKEHKVYCADPGSYKKISDSETHGLTGILMRCLSILSLKEHEEKTISTPLINRKSKYDIAAGWQYKEIKINLKNVEYERSGCNSDRKSPRWHTRAGHWQTYKSGKRVFIQNTEVGDRMNGGILKDYKVCT